MVVDSDHTWCIWSEWVIESPRCVAHTPISMSSGESGCPHSQLFPPPTICETATRLNTIPAPPWREFTWFISQHLNFFEMIMVNWLEFFTGLSFSSDDLHLNDTLNNFQITTEIFLQCTKKYLVIFILIGVKFAETLSFSYVISNLYPFSFGFSWLFLFQNV